MRCASPLNVHRTSLVVVRPTRAAGSGGASSKSFFPITECGITHWTDCEVRPICGARWEGKREAGAINLEVAMKTHFIAIGAMLLFAALAFGMDVGVTALLLMHS